MFVKDKVALVTGGCRGIGLAMVIELLKNGAKGVAIVDFSEESAKQVLNELEDAFGANKAVFVKADVTDKAELEEAFEKTVRTFNQLDIVINNAGILNEVDWEKTIAVNLCAVIRGSYLAMEKYLPKYRSGSEGVIVNTASILGLNTIPSIPAYCVSKHGVVSLGEALSGEEYYKRYQVRVLTICPGVCKTPLVFLFDEKQVIFAEQARQELRDLNKVQQSPECVGKTLIKVLNEGKNGSLWVTEDEEPPYEVEIPDRKTMRKN